MIYYRVLSRVIGVIGGIRGIIDNDILYYLTSNTFEYKKSLCVLTPYDVSWFVYKDFYSSYPRKQLEILNEDQFHVLNYREVETFFTVVQDFTRQVKGPEYKDSLVLLKDIERILLYWDDFN